MPEQTQLDAPEPDFVAIQVALCAHLRDPAGSAAPADVPAARLAVYRGLLLRNVERFMAQAFPVLRGLLDDAAWHALVADYFASHAARTPLYPRMAGEFLRYLEDTDDAPARPGWVRELASYEWLEAEVLLDPRELPPAMPAPAGDCLERCAVLNPTLHAQRFAWPVHRLAPDMPAQPCPVEPTYLAVYRGRDERAAFMELNPVAARLLERLLAAPDTMVGAHLAAIAAELKHPRPAVVIDGGRALVTTWLEREVVLGLRA